MNSLTTRANAMFAFTITILGVMTALCAFSTFFKPYDQTVNVRINTGRRLVKSVADFGSGRKTNDLGHISFDLDADFARTFDWNTKELFLYLTAHYTTKDNVKNQVVLWDHIMRRGDPTKLELRNQNTKYYFFDDGFGLKGNPNITLTLTMNVIPNAGVLATATPQTLHQFAFPSTYSAV